MGIKETLCKACSLALVILVYTACLESGSSSSSSSGDQVTISGEVSSVANISPSISSLLLGPSKFVEQLAFRGTVKCISEAGVVLGSAVVDNFGTYSLTVKAGSVENQAVFSGL